VIFLRLTTINLVKIAYIVYSDNSAYTDTEHDSLLQYLQGIGLEIYKEEWSDSSVEWNKYSCIVLKSPWDYVVKLPQFYAWLEQVKRLNIPVHNPPDVVKWNSDKHYLQDIAKAGLKVIPTHFLERGTHFNAGDYLRQLNATSVIVKPCISGASRNTFRIMSEDNSAEPVINQLLKHEAMMVQPFMPQVVDEGEWSLLFFNGRFSHALLKTPAAGDFRSQPLFGGSVTAKNPEPVLLKAAEKYVSQFAKGCLYARVDGLMIEGQFYLMELELIDPVLFLFTHEQGFENYYVALKELISH
jgi:glutathione synthase/RimK-type ligase-like ATP-grasp enzyme